MNIANLIQAVSLCACPEGGCSHTCVVCHSPTWGHGVCVRRLWAAHAATREGQMAAQRFNNMVEGRDISDGVDEKSEAAVTFIEETLGIALVPWQAELLRYILTHDGPIKMRNRR